MAKFVVSTSLGAAIAFAQRTLGPERLGVTTLTYLMSRGLAPVLNSLLVGVSGARLDFSGVFLILALFAVAALALVAVIGPVKRRLPSNREPATKWSDGLGSSPESALWTSSHASFNTVQAAGSGSH